MEPDYNVDEKQHTLQRAAKILRTNVDMCRREREGERERERERERICEQTTEVSLLLTNASLQKTL